MGSPSVARFLALVLALVLSWTGAAAHELAAKDVGSHEAAAQWVSDFSLDASAPVADLTGSAPASNDPHDGYTPIETLSEAQAPPLTMARPGPYALVEFHPPYLDGLRRPPRSAHSA
jgi:hypothetical protein